MIYQYYDKALLKLTEQNTLLGSLSKLGNYRLRTFQKILLDNKFQKFESLLINKSDQPQSKSTKCNNQIQWSGLNPRSPSAH